MNRAPYTRATWTERRATETEPKLSRAERAASDWPLWLLLAGIGLAMGIGAQDQQVIVFGVAALAVAVTLWVRELREARRS